MSEVRTYFEERLHLENDVCQVGLYKILRKTWDIIENKNKDSSEKVVMQALFLANDCYAMKQTLFADKPILDKAIEFGKSHQLQQVEVQSEIDNVFTRQPLEDQGRNKEYFDI